MQSRQRNFADTPELQIGPPRQIDVAIAETLRRAICAKPVEADTHTIPVTASVGVAAFEIGGPLANAPQLIKAADMALYNAKNSGRNCVRVFSIKPTVNAEQRPAA